MKKTISITRPIKHEEYQYGKVSAGIEYDTEDVTDEEAYAECHNTIRQTMVRERNAFAASTEIDDLYEQLEFATTKREKQRIIKKLKTLEGG